MRDKGAPPRERAGKLIGQGLALARREKLPQNQPSSVRGQRQRARLVFFLEYHANPVRLEAPAPALAIHRHLLDRESPFGEPHMLVLALRALLDSRDIRG